MAAIRTITRLQDADDLSGVAADGKGWVRSGGSMVWTDLATQAELDAHAALTTGAHGGIVASSDARLSDQRVPTDGSVSDAKIAAGGLSPSKITGTAVITTDPRLADARTPTDGSVTDAKVAVGAAVAEAKLALASDAAAGTASRRTLGTGALQAAAGNDSRLSDARAPSGAAGGDLSGTYPNPAVASSIKRRRDYLSAFGLIAATSDPSALVNSTVASTQSIFGTALYLYSGEVISNIVMLVAIAGAGTAPTLIKLALLDASASPKCVAVSANLASDAKWTSVGFKAFSVSWTVTASGLYYPSILQNGAFATTAVSLGGIAFANAAIGTQIGGAWIAANFGNAKTDIAVDNTFAFSSTGRCFWFGVS